MRHIVILAMTARWYLEQGKFDGYNAALSRLWAKIDEYNSQEEGGSMSHFDWDYLKKHQDEIARQLNLGPKNQEDLRVSLEQAQRGEGRVLVTEADAVRLSVAQTRGYILALEDVLKDTETLGPWESRMKVLESLDQAHRTLDALLLKIQEEEST